MANINNIKTIKGTVESAKYKEQELIEYQNNPFIEALPPIFSDDYIMNKFYNIPLFEEDCINKDNILRFHILKRIRNYAQVFPEHLEIAKKISAMIRTSYLARNPMDTNYLERLDIINGLKDNKEATYTDLDNKMKYMASTAESLTVIGISGMGKTTAIERLLLMYPQIIRHNQYKNKHFTRTQIVWLKIDCPYDGSLAVLFKSFFKSIDDILGTRYLEKFGFSNRVTSSMMLSMTQLASLYGIGVLVIDEIQHLINTKNNIDEMLNFLVTLNNTVSIPIVLIGTPKALQLFNKNFRQARRATGNGSIFWDRMDKKSYEWEMLVDTLWGMQCLKEYTELTDTIKDVFYEETQGITSVAINLFTLAQEKALSKGMEKITIGLLRETAKENLKILQPILQALKTDNKNDIARYDDITIDYEEISYTNYRNLELFGKIKKMFEERKTDIEMKQRNRNENLFVELKTLNIFRLLTDKDLSSVIKNAVETYPISIEYDEIKRICIKEAIDKDEKEENKRENTNLPNNFDGRDLLIIYEKATKNKKHPYELLKEQGYIKNPKEEFYSIC